MNDNRYTNGRDDIDWEDTPYSEEEIEQILEYEWWLYQCMQGYEPDFYDN